MRNYSVVISKSLPADPRCDQLAEALAEGLAANGVHVLMVPEVYHLPADAEAVKALRVLDTPVIFCSWLRERAVYWTLMYLEIPAARKAFPTKQGRAGSSVICFSLADHDSADKILRELRKFFGGNFPGGEGKISRLDGGAVKERWYPVIDRRRCKNCLACNEFCLFGVYAQTSEGRVAVAKPEACKPGCPACSRICPSQAIIFPLCEEDPAIAGAENVRIRPFDAETLAKIRKQREKARPAAPPQPSALKKLVKNCDCPKKTGSGSENVGAPDAGDKNGGDFYFDQVIKDAVKGS